MTTSPVVSITDELIAELEATANAAKSAHPGNPWYYQEGADAYTHIVRVDNPELNNSFIVTSLCRRKDGVSESVGRHIAITNPDNIKALLAHIADLKLQLAAASVDAERWRYARDLLHPDDIRDFQLSRVSFGMKPTEDISRQCDNAIDAVRNIGSGD